MAFAVSSPAFADNGAIPKQYTCEGADISPPLNWSGAPQGTRSFALIVDDPDAPDPRAPKLTWVHWVVHNIPDEARGLPEDASGRGLPAGAIRAHCRNDASDRFVPDRDGSRRAECRMNARSDATWMNAANKALDYASGITSESVCRRFFRYTRKSPSSVHTQASGFSSAILTRHASAEPIGCSR